MARDIAFVALAALTAASARDALAQPSAATMHTAPTGRAASDDPAAAGIEIDAQGTDTKLTRRWVAAAQVLMQRGTYYRSRHRPDDAMPQFESAASAYRKAIEASDDVNLRLELASAEEQLGKLDEAVRQLRLIVQAKAGVRPDILTGATAKLEALSAKVGLITLAVAPAGTSVTLGGSELGTSPLPEALVLMPGTYTLSFRANGRRPKEAEIKIEAGSEIVRAIELEPMTLNPPVVPIASAVARAPRPVSTLPLYVGAGVTGAAVVSASLFGILALSKHATFTSAARSAQGRDDARETGQRFALISDVSLGAAVCALGVTLYWYRYKYKPSLENSELSHPARPAPVATKLDVVPWVQRQSGGVALAGRF